MVFSNTNWNLYKSFLTVFDTRSLHKAAAVMRITRSGVGQNVKQLAEQLGVVLFRTHRKGVEPTEEAHKIYPKIKMALETIRECEESIKLCDSKTQATIKVAIISTVAAFYLQKFFKVFSQRYPDVRFEFFNRAKQESFNLLVTGKVDLIIDLDHVCNRYNLSVIDLFTLDYAWIASKEFMSQHKLSTNITIEQLTKLPIIGHQEPLADLSKTTGYNFEPYIATCTTEPVYSLVREGLGVGFCPRQAVDTLNTDKEVVKLNIKGLPRLTTVISCGYTKQTLAKVAKQFITELREYCSHPAFLNQLGTLKPAA